MKLSENILWFDTLESTNTTLGQLCPAGLQEGMVVAALYQTQGKGQKGNTWESAKGMNVLCSIALIPDSLQAKNAFFVSMAVSLGICNFIEQKGVACSIKWPNDIYVDNKKICGILIEQKIRGHEVSSAIVGIGLNVNQQHFCHAPNPTSMRLETGKTWNVETVLEELLASISEAYNNLQQLQYQTISEAYIAKLYRLNQWHPYIVHGAPVEARIAGVKNSGELLLEERNGTMHQLAFKQVAFVH